MSRKGTDSNIAACYHFFTSQFEGNKMKFKHLNLKYTVLTCGFILQSIATYGFSYNYLTQRGFEDGPTGIVLALFNLLAIFIAPAAGDLVDRYPQITQKRFISGSFIVSVLLAMLMSVMPDSPALIAPAAVISFACASATMPLIYSMAFDYEEFGGHINYGLCRGIGSLSYAIGSTILGRLWAAYGYGSFTAWMLVTICIALIGCWLMPEAPTPLEQQAHDGNDPDENEPISITQFFSTYPATIGVLIALVLLFTSHCFVNNYMGAILGQFVPPAEIERIQGNALFIQAIVELPTMACFSFIAKKFSTRKIMAFASIAWTVKHVLVMLAHTIPLFYFTMILQMFSFAAITPAMVFYANEQVDEADRNKSQGIFAASISTGAVLANLAGGLIIQLASVQTGLLVGSIVSTLGTVLMLFSLRKGR